MRIGNRITYLLFFVFGYLSFIQDAYCHNNVTKSFSHTEETLPTEDNDLGLAFESVKENYFGHLFNQLISEAPVHGKITPEKGSIHEVIMKYWNPVCVGAALLFCLVVGIVLFCSAGVSTGWKYAAIFFWGLGAVILLLYLFLAPFWKYKFNGFYLTKEPTDVGVEE